VTTIEFATIAAILVGPIAAVALQLGYERRKKTTEFQVQTMRTLLATRHLPSDANYSTAINLIPIDFNKNKRVMAAHKEYIEQITFQPTPENLEFHNKGVMAKQTSLIFEMAKVLGYDLPETYIQTTAYAAGGFIARDNIMLEAWQAWPRIAQALELNNQLYSDLISRPTDEGE
jgi:hypothetical protein